MKNIEYRLDKWLSLKWFACGLQHWGGDWWGTLPFLIPIPSYHGLTICQWLYNLSDSFLSSWFTTLSRDTNFNSFYIILLPVLCKSLCPFNHSVVLSFYLFPLSSSNASFAHSVSVKLIQCLCVMPLASLWQKKVRVKDLHHDHTHDLPVCPLPTVRLYTLNLTSPSFSTMQRNAINRRSSNVWECFVWASHVFLSCLTLLPGLPRSLSTSKRSPRLCRRNLLRA